MYNKYRTEAYKSKYDSNEVHYRKGSILVKILALHDIDIYLEVYIIVFSNQGSNPQEMYQHKIRQLPKQN